MRAVEFNLQQRMLRHAKSIFGGIGVDFRLDAPADYRLYSTVEITGADPNGIGLIGYDSAPQAKTRRKYLTITTRSAACMPRLGKMVFGIWRRFPSRSFWFFQRPHLWAHHATQAPQIIPARFSCIQADRGGRPIPMMKSPVSICLFDPSRCPNPGDRAQSISCAIFALEPIGRSHMAHEGGSQSRARRS